MTVPNQTPIPVNPSPPVAPIPSYNPAPHTPIDCPKFTVQAVLGPGSPSFSELDGATVQFIRLVTRPGPPGSPPQVPGVDGSGADAKTALGKTGSAEIDPGLVPYNAPIWKLGYRVDILYKDTTFSAYGAWMQPVSGLNGQADQPGVIYVPVYPNPTGQVVWGN